MNRLVKAFSNFKEFYSEINGATLTGAIDVIVVEQPDGEFQCSPFHVRFGKLGVLRSREKVVDIEINGEPVDIHMKLGESGEAFFVEEIAEDDGEEVPENMATSPIPTDYFPSKFTDEPKNEALTKPIEEDSHANEELKLPIRRNSIDLSKENDENEAVFQNQVSSYSQRRHTDTTMERRNLDDKLKEYTTRKLREEWAEHEEMFQLEVGDAIKDANDIATTTTTTAKVESDKVEANSSSKVLETEISTNTEKSKDDGKGKKKRKRKSQLKKRDKNTQRKSSSSSSISSSTTPNDDAISITNNNNNSNNSSNEESQSLSVTTKSEELAMKTAENTVATDINIIKPSPMTTPNRIPELDIHFFSDTEVGSSPMRGDRPSSPIQSDSELEMGLREKVTGDKEISSASWKWGELPQTQSDDIGNQDISEGQRNSMLSGMFSFMKRTNKLRKTSNDGGVYLSELDAEGMDPEMAALYFPSFNKDNSLCPGDDDRESGNGTSLPHSPSSLDGPKSIDSDYDDGKTPDKYLDFVSMSLCGGMEKGGPTDEEFDQNIIKYSYVCENPSLFSSPNLVVRLNGKYYSWSAACPIVMTIITFQKPLTNDAISQLMNVKSSNEAKQDKQAAQRRPYSSWFYWRRSGGPEIKNDMVDNSTDPISHQTEGSNTPEEENTASHTDTPLIADNTSAILDGDEFSQSQNTTLDNSKSEKYKKSLRLSSEAIKKLNLKAGMNEIEFSVTTAYQGTSRCKCYLFRWKHSDKVVISDIDGTITKSDVLGHILPMVGKDWAQLGVAQLFSKIEENGYKLLYLSARAIGQSRATREYLRSIRQGDVKLPDGPLLLNPTSLISAFHREVIERKPEEFKIACLSDIQALFPEKNPFYAGYGNRINDVWAYRAVGIPIMRIFTINTKGELKHELTQTFQSSYINQSLEVNEIFPYIQKIIDDSEKKTDVFDDDDVNDDDDDDDELQFSCSSDNDDDYNVASGNDDDNVIEKTK